MMKRKKTTTAASFECLEPDKYDCRYARTAGNYPGVCLFFADAFKQPVYGPAHTARGSSLGRMVSTMMLMGKKYEIPSPLN